MWVPTTIKILPHALMSGKFDFSTLQSPRRGGWGMERPAFVHCDVLDSVFFTRYYADFEWERILRSLAFDTSLDGPHDVVKHHTTRSTLVEPRTSKSTQYRARS